jgi:alanyl-tRNA synthetase
MMTDLVYLEEPTLFTIQAKTISSGKDKKGDYIILDRSIFYPQGGGQPADHGKIKISDYTYNVYDVRLINTTVYHYVDNLHKDNLENKLALISIDSKRRCLNTCYHTAGHLLGSVANEYDPKLKAIKGHQFPGEAYVEFKGDSAPTENLLIALQERINNIVAKDLSVNTQEISSGIKDKALLDLCYEIPKNKKIRFCHIEGYSPTPCGGTHVVKLKDLGNIHIKKVKRKKEKIKISYELR